jgi:hypothetical protein
LIVFFHRRKQRERSDPEPPRERDARAYALLEEARLRCEALRGAATTSTRREALHRVHRELGLAGLFASSNLPTSARHALLANAHGAAQGASCQASDAFDSLVSIVVCCCDAVEHGLVAPGLSDHMHLAHVHLLRAQELLEERLAGIDRSPVIHSRR